MSGMCTYIRPGIALGAWHVAGKNFSKWDIAPSPKIIFQN